MQGASATRPPCPYLVATSDRPSDPDLVPLHAHPDLSDPLSVLPLNLIPLLAAARPLGQPADDPVLRDGRRKRALSCEVGEVDPLVGKVVSAKGYEHCTKREEGQYLDQMEATRAEGTSHGDRWDVRANG